MPQDNHDEAEIAAMPTDEFRAWVKTLPSEERWIWRTYRRRLSQARYEAGEKRMWIQLDTTFTVKEEDVHLNMEGELLKAYIATLPEEERDKYRAWRRRELGKRWRRENAERHRSASKEAYERMKEDPVRWEEYKARKRELMAERRKRERGKG